MIQASKRHANIGGTRRFTNATFARCDYNNSTHKLAEITILSSINAETLRSSLKRLVDGMLVTIPSNDTERPLAQALAQTTFKPRAYPKNDLTNAEDS
jgi:hypothetical protein